MRRIIVVAAATLMALAIAGPASAHVTANPSEAPSDSFFKTNFRVGHGCDGAPTTEVSLQLPGTVTSVHPQVVAGWDIETKIGELDEPIELHGETITEGVREIIWTATDGGLPDDYMQEFGVSMRLPAEDAGEPLWFPFVQECPKGSHEWIEIPDSVEEWGDLESPAPYVVLTEAEEEGDSDADEAAATNGAGGTMTEEEVRTIAAEEASDVESGNAVALLGVILGAIGVAFGITANLRARRAVR
ncbi:MAG: YcnI family protein [Actinomycetota bacterium]